MASPSFVSAPFHEQYGASPALQTSTTLADFRLPPGYTLSNNNWYNTSPAPFSPSPGPSILNPAAARHVQDVRENPEETEESPQPDLEALPPPPHDPDEMTPMSVMRPCSMASAQIAPTLRCAAMLKPEYTYRMCESCRMRYKLAELRARGVRYEGKKVARQRPGEPRKGRGSKASKKAS